MLAILAVVVYLLLTGALLVRTLFAVWPHPTPSGLPTAVPSAQSASGQIAQPAGDEPQYRRLSCDPTIVVRVEPKSLADPDCVTIAGAPFVIWAEQRLLLIVLTAGALGGLLHALRSVAWYVGNRELRRSWILNYVALPPVGALLALLFYLVVRGGFFSAQSNLSDTSPYGFAAVAALVGLFSVQAILKLRAIAETAFTRPLPGKDSAPPQGREDRGSPDGQQGADPKPGVPIASVRDPGAALEEVLAQRRTELWRPGVTSIGGGVKILDGGPSPSIRIKVAQKVTSASGLATLAERGELFPSSVRATLRSGEVVEVPIDVVEDGVPSTSSTCCVGSEICNAAGIGNSGTIGAVVRRSGDGGDYVVTCYHVVRVDQPWSGFEATGTEEVVWVDGLSRAPIGSLVYGIRDDRADFALVKLHDGVVVDRTMNGSGSQPDHTRAPTWDDVFARTTVRVTGMTQPTPATGNIVGLDETVELHYADGSVQRFNSLIAVSRVSGRDYTSVTKGGDSGAIVTDAAGAAIGMVIGGGRSTTYVMPIDGLFRELRIQF